MKPLLYIAGYVIMCGLLLGADEKKADRVPWVEELLAVKIPEMVFDDATPEEAIDFIRRQISYSLSQSKSELTGISILTKDPKALARAPRKFDYDGKNVPLGILFQDLAEIFESDIHITSVGVIITAPRDAAFSNPKGKTGAVFRSYKGGVGKKPLNLEQGDSGEATPASDSRSKDTEAMADDGNFQHWALFLAIVAGINWLSGDRSIFGRQLLLRRTLSFRLLRFVGLGIFAVAWGLTFFLETKPFGLLALLGAGLMLFGTAKRSEKLKSVD